MLYSKRDFSNDESTHCITDVLAHRYLILLRPVLLEPLHLHRWIEDYNTMRITYTASVLTYQSQGYISEFFMNNPSTLRAFGLTRQSHAGVLADRTGEHEAS